MAKKRGNNEGSLHKRKNGTWRVQVSINRKRLGYSAKSKSDAQSWLRKTQDEIETGLKFESTKLLVSQYMKDWLTTIQPSLRVNTHAQYAQITNQYLVPSFGKIKLRDLSPDTVQRLYNYMVEQGKGLRTVKMTHAVLHRALKQAVRLGIVSRNAAAATIPPKPKHKEMTILDENQVQTFLLAAKATNDRFYALYHLALSTGMRQGELLGLKWSDVDFSQKLLQVQRQLVRERSGKLGFVEPKTKAGNRRIDIGEGTLAVLKDHRDGQRKEAASFGSLWPKSDLVFPSEVGTPMGRNNLRRMFTRLLRIARVPQIRFHDLRHTAASLMLNNGVPVIVASKRLGHAQPSITLDVYGHLMPNKQQDVATLMDQLLTPVEFPVPTI
jgi:integrase